MFLKMGINKRIPKILSTKCFVCLKMYSLCPLLKIQKYAFYVKLNVTVFSSFPFLIWLKCFHLI